MLTAFLILVEKVRLLENRIAGGAIEKGRGPFLLVAVDIMPLTHSHESPRYNAMQNGAHRPRTAKTCEF